MLLIALDVGLCGGVMPPTDAAAGYALLASIIIQGDVGFREFYALLVVASQTTRSIAMLIATEYLKEEDLFSFLKLKVSKFTAPMSRRLVYTYITLN